MTGNAVARGRAPERRPSRAGTDLRAGPEIPDPASRRHRHQGAVAGDQRPDDRGPDDRSARGPNAPPRLSRTRRRLCRRRKRRSSAGFPDADLGGLSDARVRRDPTVRLRFGSGAAADEVRSRRSFGLVAEPRTRGGGATIPQTPRPCHRGLAVRPRGPAHGAPGRPAGHRPVPPPRRYAVSGLDDRVSILGLDWDSTLADRLDEGAVVAKVLVGVFDRELAYCVVEGRIGAHVARDHRRIAGPRMRPSQRPGAKLAVFPQRRDVPVFQDGGDLRVAKLTEIIVAAVLSARPAEENVACRLHEALARHDRSPWFVCRDLPA